MLADDRLSRASPGGALGHEAGWPSPGIWSRSPPSFCTPLPVWQHEWRIGDLSRRRRTTPAQCHVVCLPSGVATSVNVIEHDGTFNFPVPVTQLWATMVQVERFPSWWSWLHEFTVDGHGLEPGTVLHGIVAPPLPYRMHLDIVLGECVPEQRLTAVIHGDLEGTASITFEDDETGTRAHATWTVEMMQRPMRAAARIAHPLLRWGHDRVVDATVDGFRRHLADDDLT